MNLYDAVIRLETVRQRPGISEDEVRIKADQIFGSVQEEITKNLQMGIENIFREEHQK